MSDTVESIHNKIVDKINGVKKAFDLAKDMYRVAIECGRDVQKMPFNIIFDDIIELEHSYNFAVSDVLAKYYDGRQKTTAPVLVDDDDDDTRAVVAMLREVSCEPMEPVETLIKRRYQVELSPEQIVKNYYRVITAENFIARLNESVVRVRLATDKIADTLPSAYSSMVRALRKQLDQVANIDIHMQIKRTNYETCSKCNSKMEVVPELSRLKCSKCGKIKTLYGTVFEDHQFYNQEGQKTKHGTYDPHRHFRFWMDRIQAKEQYDFPPEDVVKIEKRIVKYYPPPNEINCVVMRSILKDERLSHYNDHVPLLVKMFTGKSPPQLSHNEMRTFSVKFNKIIEIYDRVVKPTIKVDCDGNCRYYPYFIYKIAEDEFKDNPSKLKVLDYIHLQSDDTIIKHDLIYKQICLNAAPDAGLVYKTTNSAERRV